MKQCPLCRSEAKFRFELRHTAVWACASRVCGLVFADPQLDDRSLTEAYTTHYYPSNGNGSEHTYENTPEQILRQTFGEAPAKFGPLAGKKLLDFGCGVGGLCHLAHEHGIHTTAIEPDASARQFAAKTLGMKVYASFDELRAAEPNASFDIITMWDVIEHLREPWRDLEKLSSLFQPGGWLLLSTMNAGSLRAVLERERWTNMVNPTHFYYFTRRSLRFVLERAGFCAISEWRFPIWYPGHAAIRRMVHRALVTCRLQGQLLYVAQPGVIKNNKTGAFQSGKRAPD
jgi:2-polyprenyl-3-methyl-5-hydroxy-6-metoxy-1,4-benzoquinol methylase